MATSLDSLNITGDFQAYGADDRVLEFVGSCEVGKISRQIMANPQPPIMPPNIFKGKRSSTAEDMFEKRRRSSMQYNSSEDTMSNLNFDPNLLAFQQQLNNRRHSFQPLTSLREQQFAFYHGQPMPFQPQMAMPPQGKQDRSMSTPFIYTQQLPHFLDTNYAASPQRGNATSPQLEVKPEEWASWNQQ